MRISLKISIGSYENLQTNKSLQIKLSKWSFGAEKLIHSLILIKVLRPDLDRFFRSMVIIFPLLLSGCGKPAPSKEAFYSACKSLPPIISNSEMLLDLDTDGDGVVLLDTEKRDSKGVFISSQNPVHLSNHLWIGYLELDGVRYRKRRVTLSLRDKNSGRIKKVAESEDLYYKYSSNGNDIVLDCISNFDIVVRVKHGGGGV